MTHVYYARRVYNVRRRPHSDYPEPEEGNGLKKADGTDIGDAELVPRIGEFLQPVTKDRVELVVVRPNIEHNMLGIIMVSPVDQP